MSANESSGFSLPIAFGLNSTIEPSKPGVFPIENVERRRPVLSRFSYDRFFLGVRVYTIGIVFSIATRGRVKKKLKTGFLGTFSGLGQQPHEFTERGTLPPGSKSYAAVG